MTYVFDLSAIFTSQYLGWLVKGVVTTLQLFAASWVLGMLVGILLTVIRAVPFRPFEWLVAAYVELHRNVPLLVQILIWYFAMPEVLPTGIKTWINATHSELIFATIALALCNAAYVSEDLRSGIRSIPGGQYEAARAIGFSYLGAMGWVVIPQALRVAIPPLINQTLLLFKNSSLAMAIGVGELTYQIREIESYTFRTFEAFAVATAIYLAISFLIMGVGAYCHTRFRLQQVR